LMPKSTNEAILSLNFVQRYLYLAGCNTFKTFSLILEGL
jgi:hypothetical protein